MAIKTIDWYLSFSWIIGSQERSSTTTTSANTDSSLNKSINYFWYRTTLRSIWRSISETINQSFRIEAKLLHLLAKNNNQRPSRVKWGKAINHMTHSVLQLHDFPCHDHSAGKWKAFARCDNPTKQQWMRRRVSQRSAGPTQPYDDALQGWEESVSHSQAALQLFCSQPPAQLHRPKRYRAELLSQTALHQQSPEPGLRARWSPSMFWVSSLLNSRHQTICQRSQWSGRESLNQPIHKVSPGGPFWAGSRETSQADKPAQTPTTEARSQMKSRYFYWFTFLYIKT